MFTREKRKYVLIYCWKKKNTCLVKNKKIIQIIRNNICAISITVPSLQAIKNNFFPSKFINKNLKAMRRGENSYNVCNQSNTSTLVLENIIYKNMGECSVLYLPSIIKFFISSVAAHR